MPAGLSPPLACAAQQVVRLHMLQSSPEMIAELPLRWVAHLRDQPESGMTYQILTLVLNDGRRCERVPYCAGRIDLNGLPGFWEVPFEPGDITEIVVTHDRSGPPRLSK